jgi:HK97 gp10 family phage protein
VLKNCLRNCAVSPLKFKQKALNPALRKGAQPIRDTASRLAPKGKTLKLSASIRIATDKKPQLAGMDARVVVWVPWRNHSKDPFYWVYQEFGTSKMAPQPFMRPAFDAEAGNALAIIITELSASVPRIAATL